MVSFLPIAVMALSAVAPNPYAKKPDAALIAKAEAVVAGMMHDPASARFQGITVATGRSGGWAVCGRVNAGNDLGGRLAFTRFVYESAFDDARIDDARIDDGRDAMFWKFAEDCAR